MEYSKLPSLSNCLLPSRLKGLRLEYCVGIGELTKAVVDQKGRLSLERIKLLTTNPVDLEPTYRLLTSINGLKQLILLVTEEDLTSQDLHRWQVSSDWKWTNLAANHAATLEKIYMESIGEVFVKHIWCFPTPHICDTLYFILKDLSFPKVKELFLSMWFDDVSLRNLFRCFHQLTYSIRMFSHLSF